MSHRQDPIDRALRQEYVHGFTSDIATDIFPPGLNEEVIKMISSKKGEPAWMLEKRLEAYREWCKLQAPQWGNVSYPPIDYQTMSYYAAPQQQARYERLDEVDPALLKLFDRLGIPLEEQKMHAGVAVDAVLDSVSVATTFKEELRKHGIIFCSLSEAIREHPNLVQQYYGKVVPAKDNFFAALNSAVFTDGSFCYVPKGVRCPMELSTYFRINAANTGQFERTLIIAEEGSYVSYLEGCTAPRRDTHQLHAAVVEIYAAGDAEVRYATVQNWYPGDETGKGGVYNFVTKRGLCAGERSKISWAQVEVGAAITWKYPSCILKGDNSVGEFYSIAVTKGKQQADTGSKMIHLGKDTKSRVISKSISADAGKSTYRGLVKMAPSSRGSRNFSQCDSMLIGDKASAYTIPYIEVQGAEAVVEHEATTSKIGEKQLLYCQQRGMSLDKATGLILHGFAREVFQKLPMEFAGEGKILLEVTLEKTVG